MTADTQRVEITGRKVEVDPDEVLIALDGETLSGWKSVRITAGMESCPRVFTLGASEFYPGQSSKLQVAPGAECKVYLGRDLVVTGFVNRWNASIGPAAHNVSITGRGACQDLVDCAAYWKGQVITASSVLEVARKLAAPFGVKVSGEPGPPVAQGGSIVIPYLVLMLGETVWEVVERLCRVAGLLAYELADGSLQIVANPGELNELIIRDLSGVQPVAASGVREGVNVLQASANFSDDGRFSEYRSFRYNLNPFLELGEEANLIATAKDPGVQRYRPRFLIAEWGHALSEQNAVARARWEASRRWGRSRSLVVTIDSWRDSAGKLFQPNTLVPVDLPTLKVEGALWMVGEVTYRKDAGGTQCDLVLMPHQGFAVQPTLPAQGIPADVAIATQRLREGNP
jgi:prophage tail gpP-like protein